MAPSELEALVGHLFVVDGRAINAASPGAIAVPAPRRAARGRDTDTFFGLLALEAGQRQPASFFEPLTEKLAATYFSTSGSVTSALRKAAGEVNHLLLKANDRQDAAVPVGLACAILRESELYLLVSGPARCMLVNAERVERFPADDELDEAVFALGIEREPDLRFYHRDIKEGEFLFLADSSLNHLREITIRHALERATVDSALANLQSVAGDTATAVVVQFVAPLPQDDAEEFSRPETRQKPEKRRAEPEVEAEPQAPDDQDEPAEEAAPKAKLPFFQQTSRDLADGMAKATEGTRTLVEKMLPEDEIDNPMEQRWQLPLGMQIGVAVAIAALVALLTTVVYRYRGQTSQYAQLIRDAQAEIEEARAGADDQAAARPHWETALYLLDEATDLRPPSDAVELMRQEALSALDSYDHVTRVSPMLLREYQPGAVLRGPIVQGLNLYVLDTTNDILYREDLDEAGVTLVNREPQIITRKGDLAGDQVVSGLIDLVWIEDGGLPQRNVLGTLSRNGLLITYSPSWDVTAFLLPGYEAWVDPRAIAIYDRDLYILDAGANEIWRYQAGAEAYDSTPQRYFTDVEPQLGDGIDMEIDSNGHVYVLHASGRISKYFFGSEEQFDLIGLPQPVTRPTALFLSLSLFDRAFFVADPGGGRLYTTAVTGTFIRNYKDTGNTIFNALSGVYNQDQPPFVYVTAGNALYYFSLP